MEVTILLPQHFKCWDYRQMPLCPTSSFHF
jgi:hypothetical protein